MTEASIIGIAVGAAMAGLLPVAEIQFADFIHSSMDHIINEAAKIRYRTNNGFGCPLVIRTPYGAGIAGGPQCVAVCPTDAIEDDPDHPA